MGGVYHWATNRACEARRKTRAQRRPQARTQVSRDLPASTGGPTLANRRHDLAGLEFSGRLAVEEGETVLCARCKVLGTAVSSLYHSSSALKR